MFFLSLLLVTSPLFSNEKHSETVFILQMVEHPALNATRKGIESVLNKKGISTHYESAQGNPALASQIAQKFVGGQPKILVGLGTQAAQSLLSESHKQIPIIFSSVTDPVAAKLVTHLKSPPSYITGVSNYVDVSESLSLIKDFLPNLSKLGIIYNPGEINSVTLVEALKKKAHAFGITVITATANSSLEVSQATNRLANQVDAIFINNDNTSLSAFDSITKIANQHKIPVFVSDGDLITQGAFAAIGPNQFELGVQTGHMILKVLDGEKLTQIPVEFPLQKEVLVNRTIEKKLGIIIPDKAKSQVTGWVNP